MRRLWPRRWRRSDVYHRLVALDRRFGIADRLDRRAGRPQRERVIQDVEVPVEQLPEFLAWFDERGRHAPGVAVPGGRHPRLAHVPARAGRTYVNVGFWGTVHVGPEAADAPLNRAIEDKVHELGGHKSLYSEAFYDRETFDALYDGANLAAVKATLRPRRPIHLPLRQGGARQMTTTHDRRCRSSPSCADGLPVRFTAYDGSAAGPPDATSRWSCSASAAWPTCSPPPATSAWRAPTSPATST